MSASTLEICDLAKTYGDRQVLTNVGFAVHPGEVVALLGQNGAGKTTIMNCVSGVIHPTSGDIRYDGVSILPQSEVRNRFGILIDAVFYDYLNVETNLNHLLVASGIRDRKERRDRIDRMLTLVGLADRKKKKVRSFSFGMRQRLGLAQALMHDAELIMLDEPLVGLDPPGKALFKRILIAEAKERGRAVLFSSHDLPDVAEICDRIVMIKDGTVVYDDAYRTDRRLLIQTHKPVSVAVGRVVQEGATLILDRPDQLNALITNGAFTDNPILDIVIEDDSLLRLFRS